jgi:Uma2 family endonuclease
MDALVLDVSVIGGLSDDELFRLCASNRTIRIERTAQGELMLMHPTGGETGNRNFDLAVLVGIWNRQTRLGRGFDSNTGFLLPNGAMRAPDVAWVRSERWDALSEEERKKFLPLCPDFVIELRSESDRLGILQEKMREWIDNGCRLGWLIDPVEENAYIYRSNGSVEAVESFDAVLSGEDVLPGFELSLSEFR